MSNPSNLYAEKVFAEHPSALWSLDENIDYISFITNAQRSYTNWAAVPGFGAIDESYDESTVPPPYASPVIKFSNNQVVNNIGSAQIASNPFIDFSTFDPSDNTFTLSASFYSLAQTPGGYSIGISYYNPVTASLEVDTQFFSSIVNEQWVFVSGTFNIPENILGPANIVIAANYYAGVDTSYEFLVSTISVGQDNNNFVVESPGVDLSELTSITSITGNTDDFGIAADAYGLQDSKAYYLVRNNRLMAKNTSIPMVFGASNLTVLYPNGGRPSLIVPGMGFMNQSGLSKEYTLECWIRVQGLSTDVRRIIGPIGNDDGIYVDGLFLKLKIGSQIVSYYLGEISRPMLLDLRLSRLRASVLINGEEVISMDLPSSVDYPAIDSDWIGFYSYDDIYTLEIDCVAIYPYLVPSLVAKRRFAFGQAVESPEGTNKLFAGQVVSFDYKFADYTNNYGYPNIGRWEQGILDNASVINNRLSAPQYDLPQIFLKTATQDQWYQDQFVVQPESGTKYVQFGINDDYLYFEKAGLYYSDTKAIYGIFEVDEYPESQTIFRLEDSSGDYLDIRLEDDIITYNLKYRGAPERVVYQKFGSGVVVNTPFFLAIDVDGLSRYVGGDTASFMSNVNNHSLYVGNNSSYTRQFTGKMYRFGISNKRNLQKIAGYLENLEVLSLESIDAGEGYYGIDPEYWSYALDGGTPESFAVSQELIDHVASYTIVPNTAFSEFTMDISVNFYWEDSIALTYFAQYVSDIFDKKYYDLDFIQFNMDQQRPLKTIDGKVDTSLSKVKAYVTFQYLSTGANAPSSNFIYTEALPENRVVTPGENWISTKYEVADGVTIYPPRGENIESLAIVVSLEADIDDTKTHDLKIRKLELASQAFNERTANPVGTKYGIPVYPYSKYGSYYDYKSKNPFVLYKGSSPYLYLTNSSGFEKVGTYDTRLERGMAIPINPTAALDYRIIAAQMFIKPNIQSFSSKPVPIFEIQGANEYIKFYIQAINPEGTKARIYALNAFTGGPQQGIAFYVNGKLVLSPVISINEWMALGVAFASPLVVDEAVGALRFVGPLLVNNIAFYESTSLQELQRQSLRSWFVVSSASWVQTLIQNSISNYIWNDVLVLSSISFFGISPKTIYQSYTGTNKVIVDDSEQLSISNYEYSVINNVSWSSTISSAL